MSNSNPRITDSLKEEVDQHEKHLKHIGKNISHANSHIVALADLAQRLKFHLEVKKSLDGKQNQQTPPALGAQSVELQESSEKEDGLYFQFPKDDVSHSRDFLTMVESLVEGILLVRSEINLGKIARDLQGSTVQDDLQKWRQVITVLQKYDDQVRRAVDYFERQQSE